MANSRQIKKLATNPGAYMRFQATGALPRLVTPASPLITLLQQIHPRDRIRIYGVSVSAELGYTGQRVFHTAAQALLWLAPQPEMLEDDPWPAEQCRIKAFSKVLSMDDLLEHCATWPEEMPGRYPRLARRPAPTEAPREPPRERG